MLFNRVKFLLVVILLHNEAFCQHAIDNNEIFTIGGIKQYVRVKGRDDSKPILLFLHGGPGGSLLSRNDQITGKLQEHFVVVQWEQRETGETLKLNKSPKPLLLNSFYTDTHELIDTLLKKFQRPKLYLVGYSWGSALGFYIADKYPGLLYAFVCISPVIDQKRSDSLTLAILKETMGSAAAQELAQVKVPFENWEQLYAHRKWMLIHNGVRSVNRSLPKNFVAAWADTWFDVWSKSCEGNRFESLPTIDCPVYFFAGEKDLNTYSLITKEYFNKISAPKKDLFVFSNAGHEIPETNAREYQQIIIDKILPATFAPGG